MTWVFAAVVVVALAVIAVVASGAGEPMKEVAPDRAAPPWQPGAVTADDLRRTTFSTAVRGYRMDEVDALLDALAQQLADVERAEGGAAGGTAGGTAPTQ